MTAAPKSRGWSARAPRFQTAAFTGYSRFVRLAKIALPVCALIIVGVVIARLSQNPQQQMLAELPREETTTPGQSEVVQAQYEGRDAEGRPYTLIAAKAARSVTDPDTVLLEKPRGDMTLKDGSWVAVEAAAGAYDTKKETLVLSGDVAIFHDRGYEMHLKSINLDLAAKTASSKDPVTGQSPLGQISAANMAILDAGNRIVFGGPARMTLYRLGKDKG